MLGIPTFVPVAVFLYFDYNILNKINTYNDDIYIIQIVSWVFNFQNNHLWAHRIPYCIPI